MGRYWAIGCLSEIYRAVAIVGVVGSILAAPFTLGMSLIGLPIIFFYIVVAQLFRLLIDLAQSSRGTYQILKRQYGMNSADYDSPHGMWGEPSGKPKRQPRREADEDYYDPRTRR